MAKKSNLSRVAKKSTTTARTAKAKTTTAEKTQTVESKEEKTKRKVDELLSDLPIDPKKKDDLLELDESSEVTIDKESVGWLQEQLGKLAEENEKYKREAEEAKANYKKLFDDFQKIKEGKNVVTDAELKQNVSTVFNELQSNYFKFGKNFVIAPVAFMNRLVMYFPFLEKQKKF
jgi:hypothetical protein